MSDEVCKIARELMKALGCECSTSNPGRFAEPKTKVVIEWRWVGTPPTPPSTTWTYKVMPTTSLSDLFRSSDVDGAMKKAKASPPPEVIPLLSQIRTMPPEKRFVARQAIEV